MKEKNGRNRGVSRESTRRDLDASKRSSGLSLATRITQRLLRHDGVAGVVAGSSTDPWVALRYMAHRCVNPLLEAMQAC
jgi:hypothetical protein